MDKGVSSYEHVNKSDSSRSVEGRHVIRITIQGEPLGVGIFKDKEGTKSMKNVPPATTQCEKGVYPSL